MTPRRAVLAVVLALLAIPAAVIVEAFAFASGNGAARICPDLPDGGCPPSLLTEVLYWGGLGLLVLAAITLLFVVIWGLRRAIRSRDIR